MISSFLNSFDWGSLFLRDPVKVRRRYSSKSLGCCLPSRFSLFTFAAVSLEELLGVMK